MVLQNGEVKAKYTLDMIQRWYQEGLLTAKERSGTLGYIQMFLASEGFYLEADEFREQARRKVSREGAGTDPRGAK